MLLMAIRNGYSQIIWMDCDAIVTNFEKDRFVSFREPGLHASKDLEGLNLGVFVLSVSQEMIPFVRDWKKMQHFVEHHKRTFKNWKDQQALRLLLQESPVYRSFIHDVPPRTLNSYAQEGPRAAHKAFAWQPGDFVFHDLGYWGLTKSQENARIQRFFRTADRYSTCTNT